MSGYNVVEAVEVTPFEVASRVAKETPLAWWVECSEGCGNLISVPKVRYQPLDRFDGLHERTPYRQIENLRLGAILADVDQLGITAFLTISTRPATS